MTSTTATRLRRPQPVGVLPLPAGYLLVGEVPAEVEPVVDELRHGRVPLEWPAELEVLRRALAGDVAGAVDVLDGHGDVARVNRFVLTGHPEALDACADLEGDLGAHVRLVAYSLGLVDTPPSADGLDGEFAALAHAANAAAASEHHRHDEAVAALEAAVAAARAAGPALTGTLLGALGEARARAGGPVHELLGTYEEAIGLLTDTDLRLGLAELHVAAGMVLQEVAGTAREPLGAAVRHYQSALRLLDPRAAPELYATAHANLGTAYLTMPMVEAGDQLRVGIAVRSLRKALEVLDADRQPELWSSAQLNLANALVYMPSAVQGDNLVEAVERYDEVLAVRDRDIDPEGFARVAANLGNALAHLGIFDQAKGRLHEARAIFEELGDLESVATVRSVLDEIAKERGRNGQVTAAIGALPPKPGEVGAELLDLGDASTTRYPTRAR